MNLLTEPWFQTVLGVTATIDLVLYAGIAIGAVIWRFRR